jgi:hypothetical protein
VVLAAFTLAADTNETGPLDGGGSSAVGVVAVTGADSADRFPAASIAETV